MADAVNGGFVVVDRNEDGLRWMLRDNVVDLFVNMRCLGMERRMKFDKSFVCLRSRFLSTTGCLGMWKVLKMFLVGVGFVLQRFSFIK